MKRVDFPAFGGPIIATFTRGERLLGLGFVERLLVELRKGRSWFEWGICRNLSIVGIRGLY